MAEAVTFKALVSRADFKLAICLNISFGRELGSSPVDGPLQFPQSF